MGGTADSETRADVRTEVTAVIVNFDSGNRLPRLLENLKPQVDHVVVVDNASTDGSPSAAQNRDWITLIRNGSNLGFAAAANQGAAAATSEWVVFVNPDTHAEYGVIRRLVAHVPDDVAVVAPVQVDASGTPLMETGGHDPSLVRYAAWAVIPGRVGGQRGPWLAPPFPQADFFCDWVSGAFMAVSREAFERVHGFDERFFLYQEDVDLCRRLRTAGSRIMCRGWLEISHEVGQGDRKRRALSAARSVPPLASRFETKFGRRTLGAILTVGLGLRSFFPSRGVAARAALPEALKLLRTGEVPELHPVPGRPQPQY